MPWRFSHQDFSIRDDWIPLSPSPRGFPPIFAC